jgi:hypothetical protein
VRLDPRQPGSHELPGGNQMTHKKMTVQEVIDYIEDTDTFDDFAFRGDNYIPAKNFRDSWYHGDDMPEYQLHGVSAIKVMAPHKSYILDAMKLAKKYGNTLFLLRGQAINADEVTNDPGECLMTSHKIVCIVE